MNWGGLKLGGPGQITVESFPQAQNKVVSRAGLFGSGLGLKLTKVCA